MAVPLDPQTPDEMFPDTLTEPFVRSKEVEKLALTVLAQWDEFKGLRDALNREDNPIEIVYVLDTKKFDIFEDELKIHTIVNVVRANPLWRTLTGFAVAVIFREAFWKALELQERSAWLHHGLSHIEVVGQKVALRDHPVEGFPWTYRRYGPLSQLERQFLRAGSLWNEDHPAEPVQLRALADDVVDHAAEGLKRFAEETGTDVSITAGGRTAAFGPRSKAEKKGDEPGQLAECVGNNHVPHCHHFDLPRADA